MTFIFWFCVGQLFAQNQNYYKQYITITESFDDDYKRSKRLTDSIITSAKKEHKSGDIANIANDFSLVAFYSNEIKEAIFYSKLCVSSKESINIVDDVYAIGLQRLGAYYYTDSDYTNALKSYKKVIEVNLVPRSIAKAYCGIGSCYYLLDDYYKSVNYYRKGIGLLESLGLKNDLINEYVNFSTVCSEINTKFSLIEQQKILDKLNILGDEIELYPEDYLNINNSYAVLYSNTLYFDFNLSKYYSKLNLKLVKGKHHNVYKCTSYINLADVYNITNKDSALYFANKAIKYCKTNENISKGYLQKSTFFKNKNDYPNALENIQKSINKLIHLNLKPTDSVSLNYLKLNEDKDHLLYLYAEKNNILSLQCRNEDDITYSELALQHILVEDSLIDIIQSETTYDSKLHWRLKASEIYTQGVEFCNYLNQPKTAYYLSEKGKSLLLTEAILNNNALAKLPDSIQIKQNALKKASYSPNLNKEQNFNANLKYEAYLDSIKLLYPKYFKNKDLQNIISLQELKRTLDNNTIIIAYLWPNLKGTENNLFGLFITKDSEILLNLGKSENIKSKITQYINLVGQPLKSTEDRSKFNKLAYYLYKKLLVPDQIDLTDKNLLILPDGFLHNVPFEPLTTSDSSLNYLIQNNVISYAYSMSFLEQNNNIDRNSEKQFTAFAPVSFASLSLPTLKNSALEINDINQIINGDTFTNEKATISSFLEHAKNSKIIHLATHAEAKENPWIAFSDDKLSLQDLYTFKNSTDLTVLSSCNSSVGELATGEGVMSLARGFFYSGSKSVIASLWNVNDKSTSFLMENFYKNLKQGETKSQALRKAKLNYINSHSLSEASPYYWSSFILLGDPGEIELHNNIMYYLLIGFFLLIGIFLFIRFRQN